MTSTILVPQEQMQAEFSRILKNIGFTALKAEKCSAIFTANSVDGIYTHGVNRFTRFVQNVNDGFSNLTLSPHLFILPALSNNGTVILVLAP